MRPCGTCVGSGSATKGESAMDDVLVSTQDAHGTPVRLTRNSLTYGEEVVSADDVTAIMQQPYDAPGKSGLFVTVLVSRRGGAQCAPGPDDRRLGTWASERAY